MSEIQVKYGELEVLLNQLKSKIDALDPSIPVNLARNNRLQVIHELSHLNEQLNQVLNRYKNILHNSEQATRNAAEKLLESDQKLARQPITDHRLIVQ